MKNKTLVIFHHLVSQKPTAHIPEMSDQSKDVTGGKSSARSLKVTLEAFVRKIFLQVPGADCHIN